MDKDEARRVMRGHSAIDPEIGYLVESALFAWLSARLPGTVAGYLAMSDEVDVSPLFDRLGGWRWVLPRVETDGDLTFRDRDVPVERHRLGMDQPIDTGPVTPVREIDILLVPGLAFDARGARLGRGAGYYDRVLAQRRGDSTAVGVTIGARVVDVVPVQAHDERVDWLATEAGVTVCSPRN